MGIRRYRVKYAVASTGGGYLTRVREFSILRHAADWVRDLPPDHDFIEIQALTIEPLTLQEKRVFASFTRRKSP
jgi:hypothetical protein